VIGIEPLYFLDEMSFDETQAVYKAKNEEFKSSMEQTRLLCYYSVISMNGTKQFKKPSDLFELPWEKANKPKGRRLTEVEVLQKAEENRRNRAILSGKNS
jgi:hypothetical protein